MYQKVLGKGVSQASRNRNRSRGECEITDRKAQKSGKTMGKLNGHPDPKYEGH